MADVKSKIMVVMREGAAQQEKALGGKYPYRMATWNLRLAMEREYPDVEWECPELRRHLTELTAEGKVEKCPHESRIGQAVWRLVEDL